MVRLDALTRWRFEFGTSRRSFLQASRVISAAFFFPRSALRQIFTGIDTNSLDADHMFSFGSISGSVFAFWFFSALGLALGFACFELSTNTRYRRRRFRGLSTLSTWQGALLGVVMTLVVVTSVYLSMLSGFYGLVIRDDRLHLQYILPQREVTLNSDQIGEVRTGPSYKTRWRLHIYTKSGTEFVSAHGSFAEVMSAGKALAGHDGKSGVSRGSGGVQNATR